MSHSWALSQDWWGLCWPDPFSLRDPHPMFQGCRGWSEVLPLSLVSWPGEPGGGWDHDECLWVPVSVCDLEKCLSPHSPESLTPQSSASHFIFLLNHQSPLCYWSSSKKKIKRQLRSHWSHSNTTFGWHGKPVLAFEQGCVMNTDGPSGPHSHHPSLPLPLCTCSAVMYGQELCGRGLNHGVFT